MGSSSTRLPSRERLRIGLRGGVRAQSQGAAAPRARRGLAVGATACSPTGRHFTTFPEEIVQTPRSWAEKAYRDLVSFTKVDKDGHVAAWEEPELFASEVRAAFRSLR